MIDFKEYKSNIRYFYDLVMVLTNKEIKVRYKNSVFGYLWSLANPLFFALIYFTAFKTFMRVDIDNYTIFLICGLFPWQWMNNSINNNLFAFLGSAQIIKKTNFPRSVLPLSNILMEGFNFILSIPIIIVFLLFYNIKINYGSIIFWTPLLMVSQIIISYGISLIFSSINLFFRDIERFVQLGMMMLFYATPILYAEHMVPEKYKWIIEYNPLAKITLCWRELFMTGNVNIEYFQSSIIYGFIFCILGFIIFNKLKYRFAEVL
ncbi:ABC transporter permease [Photobacterium leiognathi]|nr:ABC transporter permease [Photobacterium leiognathi]